MISMPQRPGSGKYPAAAAGTMPLGAAPDRAFRGQGMYILEEPEAALSPQRQRGLLSCIHDLMRGIQTHKGWDYFKGK